MLATTRIDRRRARRLVNTLLIGGAIGVAAIILIVTSRWRPEGHDLGVVSSQWLAEHRQSQESQR